MLPKVSVIIPVYNAHDYLRNCLDSILNQTLKEIEVICVDDDSTDDSLSILEEYARSDPRLKVLHQENGGAGAARNNGLQYAVGEYLSIIDCDDFFDRNMLERSYQRAKENKADIIVFGCDFYDNVSQTYRECTYSINKKLLPEQEVFSAADVKQDVFKLFVGWSWDKLFRTEFVKQQKLLFQEQRTTNDMLFVFNGLLRAERITVMPDVFAHHRRGVESLSVTREKSWMCFYNALLALREEMYKIGCYERFERDYKNYCVHFSLWNLNTLKEPTHSLLYNKLRDEWFAEMGLLQHPREYFYNKYEYDCFRKIYEHPIESNSATTAEKEPGNIIAHGLQCCREHGPIYTVKLLVRKIINFFCK